MGHHPQGIGELDLPAFAGPGLFQHVEHIRGDHVPSQGGEPAGGLFHAGFFHHILHLQQVVVIGFLPVDDSVGGHLFRLHHLASDHRAPGFVILVHELLQGRFSLTVVHHIVPQDHPERFPVDEVLGAEDGVPQAPLVFLAHIMDFDAGNGPHLLQQLHLAAFVQMLFQFRGAVEMVLDGPFGMAGDNQDLFDAALEDFFHNVLDGGFVHNGQHFLGHGFGFRQEPGTEPGGRDHGFTDFHHWAFSFASSLGTFSVLGFLGAFLLNCCISSPTAAPFIQASTASAAWSRAS